MGCSKIAASNHGSESIGRRLAGAFIDQPILIVGADRSGTSALWKAVSQHSHVVAPPHESHTLDPLACAATEIKRHPLGTRLARTSLLTVSEVHERLKRLAFESLWGPDWGLDLLAKRRLARNAPEYLAWSAKAPVSDDAADGVRLLFPAARFLYIHRRGIDVVASRLRHFRLDDLDFRQHCQRWADSEIRFQGLSERSDVLTVEHADFTERPDAVLHDVLAHVGLEQQAGPAEFARSTLLHPLGSPNQLGVAVGDKLRARPDPWSEWTPDMRATFVEVCADSMARLGYSMPDDA